MCAPREGASLVPPHSPWTPESVWNWGIPEPEWQEGSVASSSPAAGGWLVLRLRSHNKVMTAVPMQQGWPVFATEQIHLSSGEGAPRTEQPIPVQRWGPAWSRLCLHSLCAQSNDPQLSSSHFPSSYFSAFKSFVSDFSLIPCDLFAQSSTAPTACSLMVVSNMGWGRGENPASILNLTHILH